MFQYMNEKESETYVKILSTHFNALFTEEELKKMKKNRVKEG